MNNYEDTYMLYGDDETPDEIETVQREGWVYGTVHDFMDLIDVAGVHGIWGMLDVQTQEALKEYVKDKCLNS